MRVLVWQNHGSIKVFDARAALRILDLIVKEVSDWGFEDAISKCFDEVFESSGNHRAEEAALLKLVESLKPHETFEVFQFHDYEWSI